jgi:hypothetical protein
VTTGPHNFNAVSLALQHGVYEFGQSVYDEATGELSEEALNILTDWYGFSLGARLAEAIEPLVKVSRMSSMMPDNVITLVEVVNTLVHNDELWEECEQWMAGHSKPTVSNPLEQSVWNGITILLHIRGYGGMQVHPSVTARLN